MEDDLARRGFSSSRSLGRWLKAELASDSPDLNFMPRVVTQELDRWLKLDLSDEELRTLAAQHPESGDERWDAFLEGLVARVFDIRKLERPAWVSRTRLTEVWAPYGHLVRHDDWYAVEVLNTPTVLLHKGVVFGRKNLERL